MNKSINTKNINNFKSENFDWKLVQAEMKNKLGLMFMRVGLKKLYLLMNLIIIYYYLFQQDSLEIGLPQDI